MPRTFAPASKKLGNFNAAAPASRELSIVMRSTESLKGNPTNPRTHSKKQIRQIAKSISTFGFTVPVLIDTRGNIVAGHGRVEAAKVLNISQLPTISLAHLSEAQIMAYIIADNRLAETGEWDERLLRGQLKALSELELDFDLDVTGFEIGEIDVLLDGLVTLNGGGYESEEIAESTKSVRVTKRDDLWLLGRNRIYCGDALHAESFARLMEGRSADLVFVDPPYNVGITGFAGGHGSIQHREFGMASGEMSPVQYTDFLSKAFRLLAVHSVDGSIHFVFIDWRHIAEVVEAARHIYAETKNLCIWTKDQPGLGSLYRSQHELVFVFKKGEGPHQNNVQLGAFGRNRSNVWPYPAINSFARSATEQNPLELHPTAKPVALVADAIMDCSSRGDVVLDSFLGSGTTLIAAERVGRKCFGIEIDPLYVDTAIRRWESLTGLTAVHAASGRKFSEIEQELANEKL